MEKIWLKSYPKGVPAEIDVNEYESLAQSFDEAAARFTDRRAYTCMGKSMTFGELDTLSAAFGAFLQSKGLPRGSRVALMMPNVLQYPVCLFGVLRAGYTVVNVNPLYTPRELEHQLKDSGAETIVVIENFAHVLQEVIAATPVRHIVVTSLGEMLGLKGLLVNLIVRHVKKMVPAFVLPGSISLSAALEIGRGRTLQKPQITHDDIAFLQYTGGTTGVAKGAMLLHRNIVANLLQSRAWLLPFLKADGQHVIITALPLYHIFSLTANCLVFMTLGAENVLIPNPRDMAGFVAELKKHKFTAFTGVNTLFNGLLNTPDFSSVDFSHLQITLGGGAAVQKAVAERWKALTGVTLVEAYGLTETSPGAIINPLDLIEYNGCIGLPIPSTDVMLRDDNGQEVGIGPPGEICIRGPQVMKGYWNKPEETAKVIDAGGWLATGDVGVVDDKGFFKIVDRKKDMVLVSGFNVYPNEIEAIVAMMPGVLECAVIGVPDNKTGEAVKVVIVKKDPALTEEAVLAHCRVHLTGYKIPRHVAFRTELPKTNVGKILRRELRDQERKLAA
ncbi:MAG: long-chain-fatty-acid--CoA ligase [Betaproteobacteria bacterium]